MAKLNQTSKTDAQWFGGQCCVYIENKQNPKVKKHYSFILF
jgi:hypothetical protein